MPDQEFEYDVFLSYTEANKAEAQNLYERLRNEAIRVFFAEETIPAGGNITLGVMDALHASRKVAIIMTPAYFAKTWPRAEFASILNKDPENKDRRLIPLLFETCDIPDLIAPLKYLDFRNADDRELYFRQLIEVLDLAVYKFEPQEDFGLHEDHQSAQLTSSNLKLKRRHLTFLKQKRIKMLLYLMIAGGAVLSFGMWLFHNFAEVSDYENSSIQIKGIVTDHKINPIEGARISILGKGSFLSGTDGRFEKTFNDLKKGDNIKLIISHEEFKTQQFIKSIDSTTMIIDTLKLDKITQ